MVRFLINQRENFTSAEVYVLTVATMKNIIFWDVMVEIHPLLGATLLLIWNAF
jgi:hypothetical protein